MTQVSAAAHTVNFGAHHAVAQIGFGADVLVSNWLKEAWPARPGVKLGIRSEEGKAATHARIDTDLVVVVKYAAVSSFRALGPSDSVLLRRELCPPLFIGLDDSRESDDIRKCPASLQEADANFVGLILHGLFRLISVGLACGEKNYGSDDQGSECE